METQIFLEPELVNIAFDDNNRDLWEKTIRELELEGQLGMIENAKGARAIPFMAANDFQYHILKELFNRECSPEQFNHCIIPLNVLDAIALCKRDQYFEKIEIRWCDGEPDPVVIGSIYENEEDKREKRTWRMKHYLIARWGEVLETWEQMRERALKKYKTRRTNEINDSIRGYKRELEDLDSYTLRQFGAI